MRISKKLKGLYTFAILGLALLQGCSSLQEKQNTTEQRETLTRWNHCLERFETEAEHYCDGHRRDVLATFPHYMEDKISRILEQKTYIKRVSNGLKAPEKSILDAQEKYLFDALPP